jgi:hypothetical protein
MVGDFSYQVVEHNGVACLLIKIESIGPTEVYIPLDEIARDASWRGYGYFYQIREGRTANVESCTLLPRE